MFWKSPSDGNYVPKYHALNDVWCSADGKDWTQLKSKVIWKERHEHSAYVFKDKIWVAGGHAQPLSSEVWSLDVAPGWFKNE
jgi:hypothetical protein